eukprot:1752392-Pleurochrysis_carterae.AAC.2
MLLRRRPKVPARASPTTLPLSSSAIVGLRNRPTTNQRALSFLFAAMQKPRCALIDLRRTEWRVAANHEANPTHSAKHPPASRASAP